jgi:competence protein ComEA
MPRGPSGAALAAGALLAAIAFAPDAGLEAACPRPAELAARGEHSVVVGCGAGAPAASLRGPSRLLFGLRLDPNRADPASLQVLPGIGPARARAIVAERRRRPFASVAELARVPGVGPRSAARLQAWLAIEAPAPARRTALH